MNSILWQEAVRDEFLPLPECFQSGISWDFSYAEDGYVSRGNESNWVANEATASWVVVPPPPLPIVTKSPQRFVATMGRGEKNPREL